MNEEPPAAAVESHVIVTRLDDEAATAVCELARSLGLDCARIDLEGCWEKGDVLARIASALQFPAWFGQNWDALFDCLTDLSWRPARGYVLVLEHAGELRDSSPEVYDTALGILGEAAAAWQVRGVPLRVLVSAGA
jgi:RNAse (barnase) inhibitor barstar